MRTKLLSYVAIAACALSSPTAFADSITQGLTLGASVVGESPYSNPIQQFDPTLGTLDSVTVEITNGYFFGTTVFAEPHSVSIALNGPFSVTPTWETELEGSSQSVIAAVFFSSTATPNPSIIGTDTFTILMSSSVGGATDGRFTDLSGSIIYNYSPADTLPAVPEPPTLATLGTGLVVIARFLKRRAWL